MNLRATARVHITIGTLRDYSPLMTVLPASLEELDDHALMAAFGNGDRDAARLLTSRLLPQTLALARRMVKREAEAEDVAQDAMMRLWKQAPDWRRGDAKVATWLYRVTYNLCIDHLRKKSGAALDDIPEPVSDTPSVETQMIAQDRARMLEDAMGVLPERQRVAIHLRHIEGNSNPEIADVLEISVEAVESLLARGKRGLKAALQDKQEQLGL